MMAAHAEGACNVMARSRSCCVGCTFRPRVLVTNSSFGRSTYAELYLILTVHWSLLRLLGAICCVSVSNKEESFTTFCAVPLLSEGLGSGEMTAADTQSNGCWFLFLGIRGQRSVYCYFFVFWCLAFCQAFLWWWKGGFMLKILRRFRTAWAGGKAQQLIWWICRACCGLAKDCSGRCF